MILPEHFSKSSKDAEFRYASVTSSDSVISSATTAFGSTLSGVAFGSALSGVVSGRSSHTIPRRCVPGWTGNTMLLLPRFTALESVELGVYPASAKARSR